MTAGRAALLGAGERALPAGTEQVGDADLAARLMGDEGAVAAVHDVEAAATAH